ncbi:MAG TPA: hypothetical protein VFF73_10470 [Planctomycetota bacterium]|nr:hypothetical protein [Planctomycetota bacterium]
MRITQAGDGRHSLENLSSGTLAAIFNLFVSAKRAGLKPTELQEEVFAAIRSHLAGKNPVELVEETKADATTSP